jgi:Fur family peroxide stress response transcriptional regulator
MAGKRPTPAQAQEKLNELGLKITHPRIVIYNALLNLKDHPTAENIYKSIHKQNPSISLGTVYKTLETFCNIGLIAKVKSAEDKVRYDIRTDNHNHLYCTRTDRIIDLYDDELKKVIERFFERNAVNNFKVHDIQLQITGEVLSDDVEDFFVQHSDSVSEDTIPMAKEIVTEPKPKKAPAEKPKTKKPGPEVPPNQLSIL